MTRSLVSRFFTMTLFLLLGASTSFGQQHEGWTWDFGDGQTGTGMAPTHTYAEDGDYNVVLCVTDNDGEVSCCTPGLPAVPIEGTSWGTLKANYR